MAEEDDTSATSDLVVARGVPAQRLRRLRKQHRDLCTKVRHKKSALHRLTDEGQHIAHLIGQRASHLHAEIRRCDRLMHAAFDEVQRAVDRPRHARDAARHVCAALQAHGILTEQHRPRVEDAVAEPRPSVPAVTVMRSTYLRLAGKFHPDKTTDEDERHRHTEIMKDLNRAYGDADVARLLALDADLDGGAGAQAAQEPSALSREITELRTQLRLLSREMSQLRGGYRGRLALEARRLSAAGHPDPVGVMVAELESSVEQTRLLCDHIVGFRDGQLDAEELLAGPPTLSGAHEAWLESALATARAATGKRR